MRSHLGAADVDGLEADVLDEPRDRFLRRAVVAAEEVCGRWRAGAGVVHERREHRVEGLDVACLRGERGELEPGRAAGHVVRGVEQDPAGERPHLGERRGRRCRGQREHDDLRALRGLGHGLAGRHADVVAVLAPGLGERAADAASADDPDLHDSQEYVASVLPIECVVAG